MMLYILIICLFPFTTLSAQTEYKKSAFTKEMKANLKAKTYQKVIDKANEALRLFPTQAGGDPEFHYYLMQGNNGIASDEARKMYLRQNADTIKYFDRVLATCVHGLTCDSLAAIPNAKGKVSNPYHFTVSNLLSSCHTKLAAASKFAYNKADYEHAYNYSKMWLHLIHPDIAGQYKWASDNIQTSADMPLLSSIHLLSAYSTKRYSQAVTYADEALKDNDRHDQLLEILCQCLMQLHDQHSLEQRLLQGFHSHPDNSFYYLNIISLYNENQRYEEALAITEQMLQTDSLNRDYWFIRGKELQYLGHPSEALSSYRSAVSIMPSDALSHSAAGNIILAQSHEIYDSLSVATSTADRKRLTNAHTKILTQAKEAFELARQHNPADTSLWRSGLLEVYYKLNMGLELKKLESKPQ